jgi:primosomal protein N'
MNKWDQLRAVALAETVKSPFEYQIRRIARWYSKTFHTPLKDVLEIPIEELVYCYYESQFEDLTPERLEEEVKELFMPESEKLLQLDEATERKVSDDEFLKEIQKESEKKAKEPTPDFAEKVEKMAESMAGLSEAFAMAKEKLKADEIPREISLNFKPTFDDLPDDEPGTAFGMKLKKPKKPKKP